MRKAKTFTVLFLTLILAGLGCGAQQDTDSNEHVVEMVSALSSCGLRCPTGYHPTSYPWSISCCGTGGCGGIYSNSVTCEPNSGSTFLTCGSGCPTGYVPTSYEWSISCCNASGCGGISNNSSQCACIPGVTCPPPPPPRRSASISASPSTLTVPYGQANGSTTITWDTRSYSDPCVWIQNSGESVPKLWACAGGGSHTSIWPYVPSGGTTTLWVSDGGSHSPSPNIAQVVVTGLRGNAPTISASPQVVSIPSGSSGSTSISYNLTGSGYTAMCVWIQNTGGPQQLWACDGGLTKSVTWPYVPKGGTSTIWLSPSDTSPNPVLATVVVTGK